MPIDKKALLDAPTHRSLLDQVLAVYDQHPDQAYTRSEMADALGFERWTLSRAFNVMTLDHFLKTLVARGTLAWRRRGNSKYYDRAG